MIGLIMKIDLANQGTTSPHFAAAAHADIQRMVWNTTEVAIPLVIRTHARGCVLHSTHPHLTSSNEDNNVSRF